MEKINPNFFYTYLNPCLFRKLQYYQFPLINVWTRQNTRQEKDLYLQNSSFSFSIALNFFIGLHFINQSNNCIKYTIS